MESTDTRRKGKPRSWCACLCMQVQAVFSITIYNTVNYRGSQASAPHRFLLLISPSFPSSFTFPLQQGTRSWYQTPFGCSKHDSFFSDILSDYNFSLLKKADQYLTIKDLWNLLLKTFSLAVQRGCLRVLPTCTELVKYVLDGKGREWVKTPSTYQRQPISLSEIQARKAMGNL